MNRDIKHKPLISIVVPTKDRNVYLFKLIQYFFKSIISDQIEFIIQDNTKDNVEILKFLENNNDPRIKYFHNSIWLSIPENCDKGISNSSGEFVTLIGDDDGFLPWIVDVCNWMRDNNIESVMTNKPHYVWSDITGNIWGKESIGTLTYSNFTKKIHNIDILKEQNFILDRAASSLGHTPRVYQSIVSRKKMDELKNISGSFFPGPSPDMANAVGLLKVIKKAVYIDFPIIITGNGFKSTGGEGIRKKHHGRIEDKSFLPKNTAQNWEKKIPFYWSGITIYAESALKAFLRSGNEKLVEKFNFNYLYAYCLVFETNYIHENIKKIKKEIRTNFSSFFLISFYFFKIFFFRGSVFIKNIFSKKLKLSNLNVENFDTINQASDFLIKEFKNKKKPWE